MTDAVAEDLEDLYENAPCGYLSLGPDGRIVKSNLTLSVWIGLSQEELLGKRLRDLLNVAGSIFYETHFAPLLRMQGFFNEVALDFITAQGAKLPVLANALERRDAEGNLLFTRVTIFQASDRRLYERELVEARAAAERGLELERSAAELREQFIAVLGHDLRNPLAGIEAGLRRIQRMGVTDATPAMLDLMFQSVDRMKNLIDDVLDLTRSRLGGGLPLQIEPGRPLAPTLRQIVDELQVAYPDREIDDQFDLSDSVDCDHGRLGQLLSNLLGNALTHGAEDQPIEIRGTTQDGYFKLWVANGGDPIPPAAMERLFQPFYRGEVRASLNGLGLGLYIASQIAQAHAGKMSVTSDPDRTVFTLVMPTRQPDTREVGSDSG
ncbi:PAS domain-containing sensor histidine kinase [Neoaquamicrobium sediminum]|uniref:PAS domain-containing sensor histidine kinase n=1 Tax=Neoaquamicrobium sediminum TaxID=1849104 RepID=UPI004037F022